MASYQAIAVTGQTILGLLADACPKTDFPDTRFELYQVKDFGTPMDEGVSLYLYRIAVNGSLRNLPPRTDATGHRFKPSLPLDLHYLLSAWSKTAARQQRLLAWATRVLEDVPILSASLLNSYAPEGEVFRPNESVELMFDQLTLADMYNLWSATKFPPQLSVGYLIRMVAVESTLELHEYEHVQTRAYNFGRKLT
jgi:Pvc16 N-terminal domain